MKKPGVFPAYFLLGIGAYFLLQKMHIQLFPEQNSWQTLLALFGLLFLLQAAIEKIDSYWIPGIILFGLGLHFHLADKYSFWPDDPAAITLIIGISLTIHAMKTKSGYFQGLLVLAVGLFLHFTNQIFKSAGQIQKGMDTVQNFWPVLLLIAGALWLWRKK
ncbi:hypothetical protein LRR81_01505 [Metabacillus sp. GX 13764]|uniref:LiaI-LiaF-like domain-containing protein n=1 Tax=Metabacillus kandeliae TaxID=2900151 RepID=UPI001E36A6A3|nr:DUF5668 domain-containing protein [Metabacillus kandeliae]MCD7032887.1 hypothetical protein [Metabacillus kandeliae]